MLELRVNGTVNLAVQFQDAAAPPNVRVTVEKPEDDIIVWPIKPNRPRVAPLAVPRRPVGPIPLPRNATFEEIERRAWVEGRGSDSERYALYHQARDEAIDMCLEAVRDITYSPRLDRLSTRVRTVDVLCAIADCRDQQPTMSLEPVRQWAKTWRDQQK
ncbi:MAG TPA: hypothetical protein PKV98_01615 [Burkholderiaceae bacterium]|nr:hypothetical protein [Burkholderiaceae bacterium]